MRRRTIKIIEKNPDNDEVGTSCKVVITLKHLIYLDSKEDLSD